MGNKPDRYALIDNADYCRFFAGNLKGSHTAIAVDVRSHSVMSDMGIEHIWIGDILNYEELKEIKIRSFAAADALLKSLDEENKKVYIDIFGTDKVRLMHSTIRYLLARFTMGALELTSALEKISESNDVKEITYLHDGKPRRVCGTSKDRGFFFPDDITFEVLKAWRYKAKPRITFIKAYRRAPRYEIASKDINRKCLDAILKVKTLLHPIKKSIIKRNAQEPPYYPEKKTLLFMYPLYDLGMHLDDLSRYFNILKWDADDGYAGMALKLSDPGDNNRWKGLKFDAPTFIDEAFFKNLEYKKLVSPLISEFYRLKLPDIVRYWRQAEHIFKKHRIEMAFWNNAPHRYPAGIVKEFLRIRGIPISGMQHGGKAGTNEIMPRLIASEFNDCDYYFSYGFTEDDIGLAKGAARLRRIIPIGSSQILSLVSKNDSGAMKEEVDIIFPAQMSSEVFFTQSETMNPRILEFQKRIIDTLAHSKAGKIILKFPFGQYGKSALGVYIEKRYPKRFMIVDHLSFTKCLEMYRAKTILIEEQSTPLNEAIFTESDIIVYNNPRWCELTKKAFDLLSKRAVVCNGEDAFLSALKDALEGRLEKRDLKDREFWQRYCVYKSSPKEDLKLAIDSLINNRMKEEAPLYAAR